jgi:hypothetical protein
MLKLRITGLGTVFLATTITTGPGFGWGDEGHQIVATIAANILKTENPATLDKANAMLAADTNNQWTRTDIASEATWADQLREKSPSGRRVTANWHFVNIDHDEPDLDKACFDHPRVSGPASAGPSPDCVVDKIVQFTDELRSPQTTLEEKLVALKFLLHFVGDIHQPLHAATRTDPAIGHHDYGGNCVGILRGRANEPQRLHAYWDTALVRSALGGDPTGAAATLMALLTSENRQAWSGGTPADWAMESYKLAKSSAYAGVIDHAPEQTGYMFRDRRDHPDTRCGASNVYRIDANYDTQAERVVKEQLARAGVRLARLLKENL